MYVEDNERMPFFPRNLFRVHEPNVDAFGDDFDGHLLDWIERAYKRNLHAYVEQSVNGDDASLDLVSFGDNCDNFPF